MRKYELMYIVRPNIEDEAKKALVERFNEILTSNGAEIIEASFVTLQFVKKLNINKMLKKEVVF